VRHEECRLAVLEGARTAEVEAHLQACVPCARLARALARVAEVPPVQLGEISALEALRRPPRQTGGAIIPDPFGALYRHKDELFRLAVRRVRNYHDAEEVVQDTLVKAHRAMGEFRRESKEITWLRSICENCCIDCWRRRTRRLDCVSLDELLSKWPGADQDLGRLGAVDPEQEALDGLWLRQAIAKLPENERLAVVLTRLCGYGMTEAAAILEVPRTTLDSRLRAALGRLGDEFELPPSREGGAESG